MPAGILAAAIEGLAPGQVKLVSAHIGNFRVTAPDGKGYWTLDWTPRMHWHAPTQQLILFGHRIASRVSAFSDTTGTWRDLPLWPWYAPGEAGHWYGWSASDGANTIYAKGVKLDVSAETWGGLPATPVTNGSNGTMYAWQSNVNRLVRYGGDIQRWQEYDPATNAWRTYKDRAGFGQHALLEYSPIDGCSLLLGGNKTEQKAMLVSPGWTNPVALPNCPDLVQMKSGSWIVPHPDGGWLVRSSGSRIYGIKPGGGWRNLGAFPELGLGYQTVAIDPVRRVVMLATTTGLHVWKIPQE